MIELTIGDLHRLVALSTAMNSANAEGNYSVPLPVGPDDNRHEVEVTQHGVLLTEAATLPPIVREPVVPAGE